jgi:hypothetical protein
MNNPTIQIHNVETGEVIEREMTADELKQAEADKAETLQIKEAEAQKVAEKAALLLKLGISESEAKLLLS